MLAEYVAQRVALIQERAYHRLVVILSATSMSSVMMSGLALFFEPAFKYLSLALLALGVLLSRRVLRNAEEKIRKFMANVEREAMARRYFATLKEYYNPIDYLTKLYAEPTIEDPIIAAEKKKIRASTYLFSQSITALRAKNRLVITITALTISIPHLVLNKDIIAIGVILLIVIILFRKRSWV
ncbi:hypothetical protein [Pyrobaculum aerophilum]|uniref:hypothetical protein n=1 Tax=Pyrobaculum aerophilum TaxID=13773 RepID=UPI002FDA3D8D